MSGRAAETGNGTARMRKRIAGDCAPWTPADDKSLEPFMWMEPAASHVVVTRQLAAAHRPCADVAGLPASQRGYAPGIVPIVAPAIAPLVAREPQTRSQP